MTAAVFVKLGWTILLVVSCIGCNESNYSLRIRFQQAELAAQSEEIELSLVKSCAEQGKLGSAPSNTIRQVVIRRGEPLVGLGKIEAGQHGIYARLFSGSCNVLAAACQDINLQTKSGSEIVVDLQPTQVDCDKNGGCDLGPACVSGDFCTGNENCISGLCSEGLCSAPLCNDGVLNGTETGVDCGGACSPCAKQWAQSFGTPNEETPPNTAIDAEGNIYTVTGFKGSIELGNVTHTTQGEADVLLVSYNGNGELRWAKNFGGNGNDVPLGISVDSKGNVYIVGEYSDQMFIGMTEIPLTNTNGTTDGFIVSFSGNGDLRWSRRLSSQGHLGVSDITHEFSGNLLITGTFDSDVTIPSEGESTTTHQIPIEEDPHRRNILVARISQEGTVKKIHSFGDPMNLLSNPHIASDGFGNVYVSGNYNIRFFFGSTSILDDIAATGNNNMFLVKYNANLEPEWGKGFTTFISVVPHALTASPDGKVAITAAYSTYLTIEDTRIEEAKGNADGVTICYDKSGDLLWYHTLGAKGTDQGLANTFDDDGNVWISGNFERTIPETNPPLVATEFSRDIFLIRLDHNGIATWAKSYGGQGNDEGRSLISIDPEHILLSGIFRESLNLGFTTLEGHGSADTFLSIIPLN